jgi:TRAP-type C4-dicarboxylate transport system substrate-binding protein
MGLCGVASADGIVQLRMAAIAPDGTAWARELKAYSRDVESNTAGAVRMKWYLGGIAGDELTALERVRKNQLDGMAGAIFCERLAPSLWVARVVGLFHDRAESNTILNRLFPTVEKEMKQRGFVAMGIRSFGSEIFFTRTPVRSMEDLRKTRVWTWNLDDFWVKELPAMGIRAVALPIEDAGAAYEGGETDGFVALPTAALAYRWSAQAKYFSELSAAFLPGCLVLSQRAFDQLTVDQRNSLQVASAKFVNRFADLSNSQDALLLNGLFEKQGLKRVPVSPQFLADFRQAADRVREQLVGKMLMDHQVDASLLTEVLSWLSELRGQKAAAK